MANDKSSHMKSAYELALERLDQQGIDRPGEGSLTDETRAQIAEIRQKAEAKLAEVEILHQDRRKKGHDPQTEEEYRQDRRRIEDDRDRKIEQVRQGG